MTLKLSDNFVDCSPARYVVQGKMDDEVYIFTETARRIIDRIDMQDCTGEELAVWESGEHGELIPLTICGCWHDFDNPLYIKVIRPDGSIAFDGWGTDH